MKLKSRSLFFASVIAISLCPLSLHAGNTWDGGGGDTNIDNGANWNPDGAPAFDLTQDVIFGSGGSSANVNVTGRFKSVTMSRGAAFTFDNGGGNLIIRSSNSGGAYILTYASSSGGMHTVNCGLQIDTSNADANKLFTFRNNRASSAQPLDINGDISLATGSTVNFNTRFECVAGSLTRFDGAISGLTNLQQSGGVWAGDIIMGGSKSMPTSNISIATTGSGIGTPTTAARLFLGESPSDIQSWGGITLNNTMKLVIGGTITAGNISVGGGATAVNTRIVGNSATNSSLSLTGGTINDRVTVGGAGTHENNLNLVKTGSGTLTIASGTHTYTGTTTVNGGTLSLSATASPLASNLVVNSGTTLTGEGSTSGALTFGTGTSTLVFVPSTTGSFTASSVGTTGATIIANPSESTTVGQTYTVLTRSAGTFSPADVAAFLGGGRSTIGGAGTNKITYTADAPATLTWKGTDGTNPTFWDVGTTFNWNSGSSDRFFTNDSVTFNDTASSFAVAIQGASVTPGNMVFNHSNNYTLTGGTIGGAGSLTKSGSGTLTLAQASGANTFSGALSINGGILSISSLNRIGGGASTRAIQLGGGTLEYTFTASNAETTDTVPVILNTGNSGISITGSYITGSVNAPTAAVTLRLGAPITGSGNLIKSGSGILSIGKNSATYLGNTFTGGLSVTAGALDIRNPDSLGDTIGGTTLSNAQLELFSFGQNAGVSFDPEPITVIGSSFIRTKNEDTDSDIRHELTGSLTLNPSSVVGIASPKAVALSSTVANTINSISANISSLEISGSVSTGAGSIIKLGLAPSVVLPVVQSNAPQTVTLSGAITGTGAVETQGEATSLYTLANPEYSGNTTVNGGILSLGADNSSNNASTVSIAATGATLDLNYTGTDTVNTLIIGGVQKSAGIWGSVASGAPNTDPALTGTGTLTVASGAAGYATWAAANAPGQNINLDHDNDGVSNGIEYFMGLGGNAFTANPVLNGSNTIIWSMGASYAGVYGTDYTVQTSPDLTIWNNVAAGSVTIVPGTSLTYTLTGAGKRFVRLLINED
jgi:autotransporter-associated beta strand protein